MLNVERFYCSELVALVARAVYSVSVIGKQYTSELPCYIKDQFYHLHNYFFKSTSQCILITDKLINLQMYSMQEDFTADLNQSGNSIKLFFGLTLIETKLFEPRLNLSESLEILETSPTT